MTEHGAGLAFDFTEFLSQRQNTSLASGNELLGEWLLAYEPGPLALARGAEPSRAPARAA